MTMLLTACVSDELGQEVLVAVLLAHDGSADGFYHFLSVSQILHLPNH